LQYSALLNKLGLFLKTVLSPLFSLEIPAGMDVIEEDRLPLSMKE